tara:strand:+ start:361 stop:1077 length:717 start_codon:yes stop_codon:yes gene_type:complete
MLTKKIRQHLALRANPSPAKEAKILAYLNSNRNKIVTMIDILEHYNNRSGHFYSAAYSLAERGAIGFADRQYHIFSQNSATKKLHKRNRFVVWHKDFDVKIPIRPQFASYQSKNDQPSLFGDNINELSNDELSKLIERAQKLKLDRELDNRYAGGMAHVVDPIKEALSGYGVSDPVALVHAGDDATFITMSATKAMPIKITIKQKGMPVVQTIECDHITVHGVPVVATLQDAYVRAQK